jgi:hypothetical protein
MIQPKLHHHWGPAFAGLFAVCLASCADNLPCNFACTPELAAEQEAKTAPLIVEPVDYDAIFGKEWVAGVGVPTEHLKPRPVEATAAPKEGVF